MALSLTVVSIFSVFKFTSHDEADWKLNHNELVPSMNYYDANRALKPVVNMRVIDNSK